MLYDSESGDLLVALTGETMISRPLRPYREPGFLGIRDLLQAADVRFSNLETLFHSYENPAGHLHMTYMSSDPHLLEELEWFGLNLLACANNHTHDYGEGGVLTNIRHLAGARIAHAGTGANYADAVAPAYLETARGRVALIAATSTSQAHARAGEQRRDMVGRPGANVMRWVSEWSVDRPALSEMRRVADALGWKQEPPAWWRRDYQFDADTPEDTVHLADRNVLGQPPHVTEDPVARFVAGDSFGHRGRWHAPDRAANLDAVSQARRMADWVIFSIHNHEGGGTVDEPSQHVRELAHDVIDAGADIVVGHGPHRDRGIEIYDGKPIFYSLGNFIAQQPSMRRQPHEMMKVYGLGHDDSVADLYDVHYTKKRSVAGPYWWSTVCMVQFSGRRLTSLRLHPIALGFGLPNRQAGRPVLATGTLADQALAHMRDLCQPFGTAIDIDGDHATVRLG